MHPVKNTTFIELATDYIVKNLDEITLEEALKISVHLGDVDDTLAEHYSGKMNEMDAESLSIYLQMIHEFKMADVLRAQVLSVLAQKDFSIQVYTSLIESVFTLLTNIEGYKRKELPVR